MSNFFNIPYFGLGVNWQDSYLQDILNYRNLVKVIEIKPEHYFGNVEEYTKELHIIAEEFPLIAHGLFLSVGSFEGFSKPYLEDLNKVIKNSPPLHWIGEHMGFTRSGNVTIPHFVNIPLTEESVDFLAIKILEVQKILPIPIAFENIPWEFAYPESNISEAIFFKKLVEKTNTPLLLDVTNLYANHVNFKWNIESYLADYPLQNVIQIHYNGGFFNKDGIYIDSHSKPTPPEVWKLLEEVLKAKPPLKAIILERDDGATMAAIKPELEKAQNLLEKYNYGA